MMLKCSQGRGCSTAVEFMPCSLEVMGLNSAGCWAFSSSFSSSYLFLLSSGIEVSLTKSSNRCNTTEFPKNGCFASLLWDKTGKFESVSKGHFHTEQKVLRFRFQSWAKPSNSCKGRYRWPHRNAGTLRRSDQTHQLKRNGHLWLLWNKKWNGWLGANEWEGGRALRGYSSRVEVSLGATKVSEDMKTLQTFGILLWKLERVGNTMNWTCI